MTVQEIQDQLKLRRKVVLSNRVWKHIDELGKSQRVLGSHTIVVTAIDDTHIQGYHYDNKTWSFRRKHNGKMVMLTDAATSINFFFNTMRSFDAS